MMFIIYALAMLAAVAASLLTLQQNMIVLNKFVSGFVVIAGLIILTECAVSDQGVTSSFQNAENCGLKPKGDILSQRGNVSVIDIPWLTAIVDYTTGKPKVVCSGTLISPRYVLSNAKCLSIHPDEEPNFSVEMKAFANNNGTKCTLTTDISLCDKYTGFYVQEVLIHPSYDSKTGLNDIALLRLAGLVSFESYLLPLCLPVPEIRSAQPGDSLSVVRWNITEFPVMLSMNEQVRISAILISNEKCSKALNTFDTAAANYMCTTKPDNVTDCDAIIGNPVMSFDDRRWHLEGFVHSCSNDSGLIIHTRVQSYMKWIDDNVKNESCITPNGEAGEIKYLPDCPTLLNAFSNPREHSTKYLEKYIYKSGTEFLFTLTPPIICCGTSPNFTVYDSKLFPPTANDTSKAIEDDSIYKYCGKQNKDGYAPGSENITTDEFPWVAAIYKVEVNGSRVKKQQFQYLTTGGLINRRYVLTGAKNILRLHAEELFVRLGEYYITGEDDCTDIPKLGLRDCSEVLDYGVEDTIIHPLYYMSKGFSNVGLLRLNKTVQFSNYIRPICLPMHNLDLMNPGDTLYSTGWAKKKKKVATSLISNDECKERHTSFNDLITISSNKFCTRDFRNGSEFTCYADDGAPVMFSSHMHQWFLVGISSVSFCNQPKPQIHTKVSYYLEWIYSNINP